MKHPIGFCVQTKAPEAASPTPAAQPEAAAVPSVVRVYFPERDRAYSYYNDRFDLHEGDVVYVSGKLAGLLGRVAAVDYNFRIRLADYERVIGAADRNVRGTFYVFGTHMLTLDHGALPYAQVRSWFFPPEADGEFVTGHGPGPTYTLDLARLLIDMNETDKYGYYHATNEGGYISWYNFTKEIYRQAGYTTQVVPVTTAEYGLSKAARPFNSRLDKSKLVAAGFTLLPTWQDALRRYLQEIGQ